MDLPVKTSGNWFAPGSSRAIPATITVSDIGSGNARIEFDEGGQVDVAITHISDRIGSIERRVEMSNGGAFVSHDNDSIDRLINPGKTWFSNVASLEVFRPRLIAFLVAAILLLVAGVQYGLPVAAKIATWVTPPQVAEAMDASSLATLDRVFFEETELQEDQRNLISSQFEELTTASGYQGKLDLLFRNGGAMGPNALALPGGTIILTDQLVELGSQDEVLAVLAHEIAHVQEKHGLQQFYRALGFAGIVAVVTGDLGLVSEEVLAGGGIMIAMAASREMELEADNEAIGILRKANIDPHNLSTMLDKLYDAVCKGSRESCEETGWFSSHPGGQERRDALDRGIKAN